jgi:hypothetical protein
MREGGCQKQNTVVAPQNTAASYKNIEKSAAFARSFSYFCGDGRNRTAVYSELMNASTVRSLLLYNRAV